MHEISEISPEERKMKDRNFYRLFPVSSLRVREVVKIVTLSPGISQSAAVGLCSQRTVSVCGMHFHQSRYL